METINIDEEIEKIRLKYQLDYQGCDIWKVPGAYPRYYESIEGVLEYLSYHRGEYARVRKDFEKQIELLDRKLSVARFLPSKVSEVLFGCDADGLEQCNEFNAWMLRINDGKDKLLEMAENGVNEDNFQDVYRLCLFSHDHSDAFSQVYSAKEKFVDTGVLEQPSDNSLFYECFLFQELDNIIRESKGKSYTKES